VFVIIYDEELSGTRDLELASMPPKVPWGHYAYPPHGRASAAQIARGTG